MSDTMIYTGQRPAVGRKTVALGLIGALLFVAACDDNDTVTRGINSLGVDFLRVFNQDRNDEPIQNVQDLNLKLTPNQEPFNP